MLSTLDGKRISQVPHGEEFDVVKRHLGTERLEAVRAVVDRLIDGEDPAPETGLRTFSTSFVGSRLAPWQYPLAHLNDVAREMRGGAAGSRTSKNMPG